MIYFSILITSLYIVLITTFIVGFIKVRPVRNKKINPKNSFSIVIPFRNEAENLTSLLQSITNLNYPRKLFEVLLINDHSQDNFQSIITHFRTQNPHFALKVIDNKSVTNSPKKDAINTAIKIANFNWIVTTDADCEMPREWLQLFNQYIEERQPFFISAPVKFKCQNSFLFHFQNLHFLSLIGSTIGGFGIANPFLCNGANLCYRRDIFLKLNGFEGNTTIASGDDVFLLEKMFKTYPSKTRYLKSAAVTVVSNSEKNWSLFYNQQIRWASKSTAYKSRFSKLVGATVFVMSLNLIILGVLALIFPIYRNYFLALLVLKSIVDFILIFKTSTFVKNSTSMKYFLPISIIYPFFIVLIGGISQFKSYTWKERNFKK